jgi:hypothetical protein
MHWGNSKWKQRPREEQAEADSTEENEKVSTLCGVNLDELLKGLLKPKIKARIFIIIHLIYILLVKTCKN